MTDIVGHSTIEKEQQQQSETKIMHTILVDAAAR